MISILKKFEVVGDKDNLKNIYLIPETQIVGSLLKFLLVFDCEDFSSNSIVSIYHIRKYIILPFCVKKI